MKGTEKQIAWAEDIKAQVMDAARQIYENDEAKHMNYGLGFEETLVGHTAQFANDHMDEAKFWIDSIGYAITDYEKRSEAAKSISDLRAIVTGMDVYFEKCDHEHIGLYDEFCAEEKELTEKRKAAREACRAAKKAARAAKANA